MEETFAPTGSYLEAIHDCLEIVEQELGLTIAGSEEEFGIARIYKRINQELI